MNNEETSCLVLIFRTINAIYAFVDRKINYVKNDK